MKSSRKRRFRFGIGFVLVPLALWGLAIGLAPTDWARVRVEAAIGRAAGQPARLGALRFGLLGGVRLIDLRIGEAVPKSEGLGETSRFAGAWFAADEVRIDLSPLQLLAGRIEPTGAKASGVELRLRRRLDGSLEFGGLPKPREDSRKHQVGLRDEVGGASGFAIELADSQIRVVDEPTGTDLALKVVEGWATWRPDVLEIERIVGLARGGTIAMAARVERTGGRPAIEAQFRVRGVELGEDLGALTRIVPALAGADGAVSGRLDLDLLLISRLGSTDIFLDNLAGRGQAEVQEIAVADSPLLKAASESFRLPNRGRIGRLAGEFAVESRRVVSPDLTLSVGSLPISLSGWSDFDGRLDYRLQLDGLAARVERVARRLPVEAAKPLAELRKAVGRAGLVRLQGRPGRYTLTADGRTVDLGVTRATGDPRAVGHRGDGDRRLR